MKMFNDENFIKNINNTLKTGGVIAFVTDTVWGLGCLPDSEKACQKIYDIKHRESKKPLILMSNEFNNLKKYISNTSITMKNLIKKYFPGALTIVSKKSDLTPTFITSNMDTVGIRVPDNIIFQNICKIIEGHVLATTSANISGNASGKSFEDVKNELGDKVDYIFEDYGFKAKGLESTVIKIENDKIDILRQGAIFL
ncbi:MAG: threonylcarbamoyl-AMP synthase [Candidatus Melainabacteria bacterium LEY3_CP_29_8]|nr:MAG: threonylcarbamoyl-AMP synthase [Candidatus Melainabacteria bacterium LEY3_CP_29_8]